MVLGKILADEALENRKSSTRGAPDVHRLKDDMGLRELTKAKKLGVVFAEGDSWFSYPGMDIVSRLEDHHHYEVESAAHAGDCIEDMAYSKKQKEDLSRRLTKVLARGDKVKAIMISGGGNDIAGDEFSALLNYAMTAPPELNDSVVTGTLERIRDAYVTLISSIGTICEHLIGERVPVIVHGYGYAVPDGRGFLTGAFFLPGPWLEPGFRRKGYVAMGVRQHVVHTLIDRFHDDVLTQVKHAVASTQAVTILDFRNILLDDGSYEDWWANELHPTDRGFKEIASRFADAIAQFSSPSQPPHP